MDAYAYLLATDSRTNGIAWILGDVGMGTPTQVPFGYISVVSEAVSWYSASGGSGGLAAAGPQGLDDWMIPIVLTVAHETHRYIGPGPGNPPSTSPFANLANPLPYQEQPGWRKSLETTQNIKKVLRTNSNIGGAATTTHVVESRYVLQNIGDQLYRVTRLAIQTQQRRTRGN